MTFLQFRESTLAKTMRNIRRKQKASKFASGRQRSFTLIPIAKKSARALLPQNSRGKRHSNDGAAG